MSQNQKMKNNTKILSVPNFESQQAWKVNNYWSNIVFLSLSFFLCFWAFLAMLIMTTIWRDKHVKSRSNQRGAFQCLPLWWIHEGFKHVCGGIVYTCSVHKKSRHHNVVKIIHNGILFLSNNVSLCFCNFIYHVYLYSCLWLKVVNYNWCSFQ